MIYTVLKLNLDPSICDKNKIKRNTFVVVNHTNTNHISATMSDNDDYDHKLDMIAKMNANILNTHKNLIKCYYCNMSPSFGYPTGKRICCCLHKSPGMINLSHSKERSKRAQIEERTLFFREMNKHLIKIQSNKDKSITCKDKSQVIKKCLYYQCKKSASFGYTDNLPKYCYKHKKPDMNYVKEEEILIYPTIGIQA